MEPSQGIETEGAGSFNHVNTQALISKITQRVLYYDILSLQKSSTRLLYDKASEYETSSQYKARGSVKTNVLTLPLNNIIL